MGVTHQMKVSSVDNLQKGFTGYTKVNLICRSGYRNDPWKAINFLPFDVFNGHSAKFNCFSLESTWFLIALLILNWSDNSSLNKIYTILETQILKL